MNQYEVKQLLQQIALELHQLNSDPDALKKAIEEGNKLTVLEQARAQEARQMIERNTTILEETKNHKEDTQKLVDSLASDRKAFDAEVNQFLAEKAAFLQTKKSFEDSFGKMQQSVDERARLNDLAAQELENKKAEFANKQAAFENERKALDEKQQALSDYQESLSSLSSKLAK